MVKVLLPIAQALQTIHHGAVEAIGGIGGDEDDDVDVERPHMLAFPPWQTGERSPREIEMALGGLDGLQGLRVSKCRWAESHVGVGSNLAANAKLRKRTVSLFDNKTPR